MEPEWEQLAASATAALVAAMGSRRWAEARPRFSRFLLAGGVAAGDGLMLDVAARQLARAGADPREFEARWYRNLCAAASAPARRPHEVRAELLALVTEFGGGGIVSRSVLCPQGHRAWEPTFCEVCGTPLSYLARLPRDASAPRKPSRLFRRPPPPESPDPTGLPEPSLPPPPGGPAPVPPPGAPVGPATPGPYNSVPPGPYNGVPPAPYNGVPPSPYNSVSRSAVEYLIQSGVISGGLHLTSPRAGRDHVEVGAGAAGPGGQVIGVQNNYAGGAPQPQGADGWPRVGALRRHAPGVRPARRFGFEQRLPPYVERDCHRELSAMITLAVTDGGLVVVTGEPLSGKTMTAWAALQHGAGDDARVHAPQPGTDLRDLPGRIPDRAPTARHVVWLDDLEDHLGEHGLTAGLLARLTHEGVLVLATMRDEAYDAHRFGAGPASRVLSAAATVELTCRWSAAELTRLAAADDPRLVDAVRWRGTLGVTEYLAVGPELWDEWRRSARRGGPHPLGHLLVRAAIDLARCGLTRGVTPKLLTRFQEEYEAEYGKESGADDAGREELDAALAWAAALRHGVSGLLVPGEWPGTWRACGSLVADAARSAGTEPLPDSAWIRAYRELEPHDTAELDALAAAFRLALTPRAASGDVHALLWLGRLARDEGDLAGAEGFFRDAAGRGDTRAAAALGHLLATRVAYAEAVPYLTAAADADEPGAAALLGQVHQHLAVHYFRIARAAGDESATRRLKGPLRPTPP
ncbi:hypothetical protein ACFYO9_23225 [Streptomyces sp. NPDC005863]|uniref:hypothetical protein n=1 Tax=unclassified Streptomyces TaxID=2593676 RepID=UPI0033E99100